MESVSREWDIVGFSFLTPDFYKIEKMANFARQRGVQQLWGGSYGCLIPDARRFLDQTFIGYAEYDLSKYLNCKIDYLIHPPIIDVIGDTKHFDMDRIGILFTSRGCFHRCTFCQTPIFCNGHTKLIPIKSIHRVLSYYKKVKVKSIVILDETFGFSKNHSAKVVGMLGELELPWIPMTRIDILAKSLDFWLDHGMSGAMLGLESLKQKNINTLHKKIKANEAIKIVDQLLKMGRTVIGFYIIGFETDNVQSIKEDILFLSKLGLDLVQVCILTPLHGTPLWQSIEKKYGKIDINFNEHTMKKLVWNHPNISKHEMEELLAWSFEILYPHYQLEYIRTKSYRKPSDNFDTNIVPEELSTIKFFDNDEIIVESRLSPCRLPSPFMTFRKVGTAEINL